MFTPVETSIGAVLLHQATTNLLYQNGNVLGVSGLLRRVMEAEGLTFFAGMAASVLPLRWLVPELVTRYPHMAVTVQSAVFTASVGAMVGWGTKTSNGCTSGHMLSGLSRLSGRSAIAVAVFFSTAMLTHHYVHPSLYTDTCPGDVPCYTPVLPSAATATTLVLLACAAIVAARSLPFFITTMSSTLASTSTTKSEPNSNPTSTAPRLATFFSSGVLFALGLQISGMSHPSKVTSFLSFPILHAWDPSLLLVLLFGVLPSLLTTQQRGFNTPPAFATKFDLPTKTVRDVDARFLAGAVAFGVGWGLTGTCPGPAVLRAVVQPVWGILWVGGFWAGSWMGGCGRGSGGC